jgi:hypothetical protein
MQVKEGALDRNSSEGNWPHQRSPTESTVEDAVSCRSNSKLIDIPNNDFWIFALWPTNVGIGHVRGDVLCGRTDTFRTSVGAHVRGSAGSAWAIRECALGRHDDQIGALRELRLHLCTRTTLVCGNDFGVRRPTVTFGRRHTDRDRKGARAGSRQRFVARRVRVLARERRVLLLDKENVEKQSESAPSTSSTISDV